LIYALADGVGVGIHRERRLNRIADGSSARTPALFVYGVEVHPLADYPHVAGKIVEVSRRRPFHARLPVS